MQYSAIHHQLIISPENLKRFSHTFLYAMRKYRIASKKPLGKRKSNSVLTDFDHAEKQMIDAIKELGINLNADWGEELDLSNL
jgi:hypothetical protein